MNKSHFTYRLIPPRPTFAADMTEAEQAVMADHTDYWTGLCEGGTVVVFGVVLDQTGSWGLAVVEADREDDVRGIASGDPAITTGTCTYLVGVMPDPSVRGVT